MRFIYFFAVMFALAACTEARNNDVDTPLKSSSAPETKPPPKSFDSKRDKLNKLIERLRENLHLSVKLLDDDNTIRVQIRSGGSFQSDSVSPTQKLVEILDHVVSALTNSGGKYEITVVGHTDNLGSQQANIRTSKLRAMVVELYLKDKGLDGKLIRSDGKGSDEPIADNDTPEGREVNRRVDLLIRPLQMQNKRQGCLFPDCING